MSRLEAANTALSTLREDDDRRRLATAAGAVLGLVLAWVHWFGLPLGGALVAIPRRRILTAPLFGLGFGALVLVAFGAWLALAGALGPVLDMGQVTLATVAMGLALPVVGSLVRGVF
jgi:hypothetical protein